MEVNGGGDGVAVHTENGTEIVPTDTSKPRQRGRPRKSGTQITLSAFMARGKKAAVEGSEGPSKKENNVPKLSEQEDMMTEDNQENERSTKKIKLEDHKGIKVKKLPLETAKEVQAPPARCTTCRQLLDSPDTRICQGHPHGAMDEYVALCDPRLSLFTGEEEFIHEHDERPQHKLTQFSVYDKHGHLCPFDSGLIETNVELMISGYLKPIFDEDPSEENGVPCMNVGPINEWWSTGYDGGEAALVGFSTACAEYYLMEPSAEYKPIMDAVREKIYMSKLVIEFVNENWYATYEDLLNKLAVTTPPASLGTDAISEDTLLRHAQFVVDQLQSYDAAGSGDAAEDDEPILATACVRALIQLAGVTLGKRRAMRRVTRPVKKQSVQLSKATTTPLVSDLFENFFKGQIQESDKVSAPRRTRCGVCDACQQPDCGDCKHCRDMVKFGGSGRSKQCCVNRRCPNMVVEAAEDSDGGEDEDESSALRTLPSVLSAAQRGHRVRHQSLRTSWVGQPAGTRGNTTYYSSVDVNDDVLNIGDCVIVESEDGAEALPYIARLIYMWETASGRKRFHATWFCRGQETLLGEAADPSELFITDDCDDMDMDSIRRKARVLDRSGAAEWFQKRETFHVPDNEADTFWFQKWYDAEHGRFEDVPEAEPTTGAAADDGARLSFCACCQRLEAKKLRATPTPSNKLASQPDDKKILYGRVDYRGETLMVGECVYIEPTAYFLRTKQSFGAVKREKQEPEQVDDNVYPEYYRKSGCIVKGSNLETPEPFRIGRISEIYRKRSGLNGVSGEPMLRVTKFFRAEDTHLGPDASHHQDLHLLYYTSEEVSVALEHVAGKCFVLYGGNLSGSCERYRRAGPDRFYFTEAYLPREKQFSEPPPTAKRMGLIGKGGGKGKGASAERVTVPPPPAHPTLRPLRTLDVFAGCGGLSAGLHHVGVAQSHWAIEVHQPAANAYRLNNPQATVFTDDCNLLLQLAIQGAEKNSSGQRLPKPGEVDLLCGGPPCQGFSGMNRFNSRQYSQFKNSLIVSFLSFCDFYRPKYFILENVRNFVSYKANAVLKLTLACLLKMGYQCGFGVLQAGSYGVPQTRRRVIILASAPGYVLPRYPEPQHVFSSRASSLAVVVDNVKYQSTCRWTRSAPYRTVTVRDAMADLPDIRNGQKVDTMPYNRDPSTHFQKMMRPEKEGTMLRDHICKEMAPLVEARIRHVPTAPGSDWRDLPNLAVRLNDGTTCKALLYTHHDKKNGRSRGGRLRGVCACAGGRSCDPADRQFGTLIPWCLPHTGNRHNHWAGLYGRLEWDGFFSTTVTNPEPMGKQGRVLHPEQHRVVSVRECARSQGFPDTYRFFGTTLDKHRQIGNAVPPPMAAAIGREIQRSLVESKATASLSISGDANVASENGHGGQHSTQPDCKPQVESPTDDTVEADAEALRRTSCEATKADSSDEETEVSTLR